MDDEEFAGQTFTFKVEEPVKFEVASQTPAADEVVESLSSITIELSSKSHKCSIGLRSGDCGGDCSWFLVL